jgi:outer membrane receptor protein involved in Fe transport
VRLAEDWTIGPTLLNHFLVAWGRQLNPSTSKHLGEDGAAALGISGLADFNYPEITGLGGDRINIPTLGYQANDIGAGTAYQMTDALTWIHGKHAFKFGVDIRWNGLNWRTNSGPGQFNFSSTVTGQPNFNQTGLGFASMLLGDVSSASVNIDTPMSSQFPSYGAYFQDDYKVSRNLTLNLGIRYEYQPQGTEKYDRLHSFDPTLMDPKYGIPGAIEFAGDGAGRTGSRLFYPNCFNCGWGPRIGFAYQMPDLEDDGSRWIWHLLCTAHPEWLVWSSVGQQTWIHGDQHGQRASSEHAGVQLGQRVSWSGH